MTKRKKEGSELYHDRVAGIYDGMYAGSMYWEFYWTVTWNHIKKYLPQKIPSKALDVGCGTGRWGLKLLKSGFHTDFLDISEKMLNQVGRKLSTSNSTYESQLIHASIDDLSGIDGNTYDLIIGQGDPLCCAQNPVKALKGLSGLLQKDGIMIMSIDNKHAAYDHYLERNDLDSLEKFIKTGKTIWLTDKKEEQFPVSMFTAESITRLFNKNNLEVLSIIGKTILPIRNIERKGKAVLKDKKTFNKLLKLEESINASPSAFGRAAHLEIIGRLK